MRYIRTKDGRIIDLEKFINEEKDTPYYTDFIFDEITKDGHLKWTAVGTDKNTMENQRGRRCQFDATLNSEIIKQADTIEELIDGWVLESKAYYKSGFFVIYNTEDNKEIMENFKLLKDEKLFAFIKTDKGLIYVAKMNEKGCLELL